MARTRKSVSSFNLSFLDIMFCGFGAVVLLVLIINSNIIDIRKEKAADHRLEFLQHKQMTRLLQENRDHLQQRYNALEKDLGVLLRHQESLLEEVKKTQSALAEFKNSDAGPQISVLEDELKSLQAEKEKLEAEKIINRESGNKVRQFEGQGNRQYLTGLKLGGNRVLVLIDSSASMLAARIVDIVRLKVRNEEARRKATKWRRAIATVEWIVANLPPESKVLLYTFNTGAMALTDNEQPVWTSVTDFSAINTSITQLQALSPDGGTSLENIFTKIRSITPRPDNIILITDGLPTQGKTVPAATTTSGPKRVELFERAIRVLPANIPVNTILFPIEGDPMASVLFWRLGITSGGSMFTPARDWP